MAESNSQYENVLRDFRLAYIQRANIARRFRAATNISGFCR